MAINLATKFSTKIDERFQLKSFTEGIGLSSEYDWTGVKTISVYSIDNAVMNNYVRSGNDRYGAPTELGDTKADYTLTKDRSFSTTIDKGNNTEQLMIKSAGKFLSRQTNEVIIPEIDIYRLAAWSAAAIANGHTAITAVTAANAYLMFLNAQAALDEDKVPITGRIAFVTPAFYNFLKQDTVFIKSCDIAQKMLINGQVGEVDGVKIIKVPSSYFPANHAFELMHPKCSVSPRKLDEYKVHQDPPGISGHLIEGRQIYDCFVLAQKVNALFAHKIAA